MPLVRLGAAARAAAYPRARGVGPIQRVSTSDHPYRLAWTVVDCLVWAAALVGATYLRYELSFDPIDWRGLAAAFGVAALLQLVFGFLLGPYAVGHLRGSFEEIVDLTKTVVLTAAVLCIPVFVARPILVPKSVPIIAGPFALVAMLGLRLLVRAWKTRNPVGVDPDAAADARRVLVFGAGEGGRQLVRAMVRDRSRTYLPVAIIDDDPRKQRLTVEGVRVRGTRATLEQVANEYDADVLAIAMPSADGDLIRDLSERADHAGLDVMVLPPVSELIGRPSLGDLRDLDLADLLGRRAISLDSAAIAQTISGKRVLVTGAGGSIGSELCRQIMRYGPAALFPLDRDESALHSVQLSLKRPGLFERDGSLLVDIRDREALELIFADVKPDIVFHAAALKHLPLLEQFPYEAYKSNVLGTLNVLAAAAATGVETVVNISTDKAADPTCMLGYSKRVAERLTAGYAVNHPGRYVSVRFGNVLGSRGSVVHAFTAQIERGGPVTVTHPDVERYFMLIPEACQLVLEAAAAAKGRGEVMVLDMGRPQKIIDVAKALIRMSGRPDIRIDFTGLRPGEKLTEDLVADAETLTPTKNPLVTSASVAAMDESLLPAVGVDDHATALAWSRSHAVTAGAVD
ncbi:MAG: polysaccharide biosynthesis protein [Actinomycetales bacterium]|nr:polysaccharide biosynthesis protein [Candidatus Phosphoribacter baldrii]